MAKNKLPSGQSYQHKCSGQFRHKLGQGDGSVVSIWERSGGLTYWMNAVAMMTPAPKYRAKRYTKMGIRSHFTRAAMTGKNVAAEEMKRMTKRAEMRAPSRPS